MVMGTLDPGLEQQPRKSKSRARGFYAVEDVLGHLIFVTWNLEEARQLSGSMILSGKVQRNLIAIRRVPSSIVTAPSTESGLSLKLPGTNFKFQGSKITSSNSATSFTLGYYVEKHYNSSKLDMSTVRRSRVGNHYVTTACLGRIGKRRNTGIQDTTSQIVALWHPVSEVSDSSEDIDPTPNFRLNCNTQFNRFGNLQK